MVSKFPTIKSNAQVRTIVDEEGTPWFVAKDVCRILGIMWNGAASLRTIPEAWKVVVNLTTSHGTKPTLLLSEPALYKLAFRANNPEADQFTNWVASEVLPTIRKTGSYTTGKAVMIPNFDDPIVAAEAIKGLGADERGKVGNSDASPKGLSGAPQ